MSNLNISDLAIGDIGRDAWGRPKFVEDKSLFSSLWTDSISSDVWLEFENSSEITITNCQSVDGALQMTAPSNGDVVRLQSKKHARYRPNRGHLFSTACFLAAAEGAEYRFGLFNDESGVFFEYIEGGGWSAVTRSTVGGVTTDTKQSFTMPSSFNGVPFNSAKGNIYDIQFQWRGVGDYYFYVNNTLVHKISNLGTLSTLSIFNPALPVSFEVENGADNPPILKAGCVDVSTEGGDAEDLKYGSVSIYNDSGQITVTNANEPVLAIRAKKTVSGTGGTILNTRDTKIIKVTGYADAEAILRVWKTRDFTAITESQDVWEDYGDGHIEQIVRDLPSPVGSNMTFDTSKATLISSTRIETDLVAALDGFNSTDAELLMTAGDMIIVTMHDENLNPTVSVGANIEFAEKI